MPSQISKIIMKPPQNNSLLHDAYHMYCYIGLAVGGEVYLL